MTYEEARHRLLNKERVKIANNTYLSMDGNNCVITLHATPIVTILPDNSYVLNSGGWRTATTKNRINHCLYREVEIYQKDFVWWVESKEYPEVRPFRDGMIIQKGEVIG